MRRILLLVVFLAACGVSRAADSISPADGVTLVGSPARITFRWPAPKEPALLEIFSSGRLLKTVSAEGEQATLDLPPGPMYQWRVRRVRPGAAEVVPLRRLIVDGALQFSFDGVAGRPGADGDAAGEAGQPGADGSRGEDVRLVLRREGDAVRVTFSSTRVNRSFLMLPSSMPLQVTTCGGAGGAGGMGSSGAAGQSWSPLAGQSTAPAQVYLNGQAGGAGGPGGNGGPGGDVTLDTGGDRSLEALVQVTCRGGTSGRGGRGGRGGPAGTMTGGGYQAGAGYFVGTDGASGPNGPDGERGPDGRVTVR